MGARLLYLPVKLKRVYNGIPLRGFTCVCDEENIKVFKKYRAWLSGMMLPQSDTPFIPKLDGSHLNKNFGRSTMTTLTREAGLPYYAPHGLRHTHATNLANTEIPIKLLSHRLGHASVKTTMDRYAKVKAKASVKYLKKVQK